VTISLVNQVKGGPFVFWDLQAGCKKAAELGFNGVEVFAASTDAIDKATLRDLLDRNKLSLAALGTGAGYVLSKLSLTSADDKVRGEAIEFIKRFVEAAAEFNCSVIIGSMQGVIEKGIERQKALGWLRDGLRQLSQFAGKSVSILLEPLNHKETNVLSRIEDGAKLIDSLKVENVKLLLDLYHANIEEDSIAETIKGFSQYIGYIHLVDSNRRAAGFGEIDFGPIAEALFETGYDGYLSAEALAWPDSQTAAQQTIKTFRQYFVKE
jgi:sugar phosphate isomerase/epimerase